MPALWRTIRRDLDGHIKDKHSKARAISVARATKKRRVHRKQVERQHRKGKAQ